MAEEQRDGETVRLAADDDAFVRLFTVEFEAILRTIRRIVGDKETARDITQEAFTRAYLHWKRVSGYDHPGAWVRRVAIRVAIRSIRGLVLERRAAQRMSAPIPESAADPDLHRALRSLRRSDRAAIVLHYFDDLPVADVAEILGCSEGTAKVRLHRARKRLAQLLGEEMNHDDR